MHFGGQKRQMHVNAYTGAVVGKINFVSWLDPTQFLLYNEC